MVHEYCKIFLVEGHFEGMRGAPQFLNNEVVANDEFIAGMTMIESIYLAKEVEPDNPFVKMIEKDGIPNCKKWKCEAPDDVILWVKNQHNRWHLGSGKTIVELFNDVPTCIADWEVHRQAKEFREGEI